MKNTTGTIGFLPILIVVLIFLKWTEIINWSWWLVLLPLWGSILFGCCYAFIYMILTIIRDILKIREKNK